MVISCSVGVETDFEGDARQGGLVVLERGGAREKGAINSMARRSDKACEVGTEGGRKAGLRGGGEMGLDGEQEGEVEEEDVEEVTVWGCGGGSVGGHEGGKRRPARACRLSVRAKPHQPHPTMPACGWCFPHSATCQGFVPFIQRPRRRYYSLRITQFPVDIACVTLPLYLQIHHPSLE